MLYITCKLVCNPIFFRETYVNFWGTNFKFTCAAFIFPSIYVLSDAIVILSNRKIALVIIAIGIAYDGIFSYLMSYFSNFELPSLMSKSEILHNNSVNIIGTQMWALFYHGFFASVIAAISEALIFSFFYKKIKNFFISTISSICIILVIHNLITDYPILKHEPDAWKIIINNWIINMTFMVLYTLMIVIIMNIRKYSLNLRTTN